MTFAPNKKLLDWINRYKFTFILVVLIGANVYQYINATNMEKKCAEERKELRQTIDEFNRESLKFERERQTKQDELLQRLLEKSK